MSKILSKDIIAKLNDAHYNLNIDDKFIMNPFERLITDDPEEFYKRLTYLLTRPEYFSFVCKHVLNIDILPFQALILKEMWNRKFPMLVGSRGLGKAELVTTPILTSTRWKPMGEIVVGDKVYGRDGQLHNVIAIHPQGKKRVCRITLSDKRFIDCCEDHLWVVKRGDVETVLSTKEIIQSKEGLEIPNCEPINFPKSDLPEDSYIAGYKCDSKIPDIYKYTDIDDRGRFVRGFLDANASMDKDREEWFTSNSEDVVDDIIEMIRSLGVSCTKAKRDSIFIVTTKYSKYTSIASAEYLDDYAEMQCISVDNPDKTYITKDYVVTHNTFILSVYSILRAILMPNRKVVVVGAAFRQSKFLHEYMENIWKNAPVLRDMCDSNSGPRRDVDMCRMTFNGSTVVAIPTGDGQKIRGLRANDIIADEFGCLRSSTLIQTDMGLVRIKDYLNGEAYDLVNMNGEFETPDKIFKTPKVDVYRIETQNGYSFYCSSIHQTLTSNGWKLCKDMTKEDWLELDFNNYFPKDYKKYGDTLIDEKMGWLMGLLVSEGTVTNRNFFSIKNTDKKLIDKIQSEINLPWTSSYKEAYKDPRGWNCSESWEIKVSDTSLRHDLYLAGLEYVTSHGKTIPRSILESPKSVIIAFLSGLFEGDGTSFNYMEHSKKRIGVGYYSASEDLVDTLQVILLKFGITCTKCLKKSKISNGNNWMLSCRGENAKKIHDMLKVTKWDGKFDGADFFVRKPIIRKNGLRYVVSTSRNNKNVHIGTYDTEDECCVAFEQFWKNNRVCMRVRSVTKLDQQEHLYDFHMPSTHSFLGNGFVQHNSQSREIFENVIGGFTAVSANPAENVKNVAKSRKAKELGVDISCLDKQHISNQKTNQMIISGTAYYDFNHFADYWKRWKAIIETKGDNHKLSQNIFNGNPVPAAFKWDDYSIMRIPVDLIPEGFMDEGTIARSKATIHAGIYQMEYAAVFTKDSQGFFKRSLIESCVGTDLKPVKTPNGNVWFDPRLKGDKSRKYVMAVDPASEVDNFSIAILELHEDHRRVVYCWTTTRKEHIDRVAKGLTTENNFYSYCGRKIRELMDLFPIVHIAMDAQGGGYAVSEALHDINQLKPGESPIWPIIDPDDPQPSDDEKGLHILEMCSFSKYDWYSGANHGLRKDLEDKAILFPRFDPITIGLSIEEDKANNRLYDTLEDCVMEIEELKNELALIEVTASVNGRERWDTPEVKIGVNKKSRMRKDRYSALMMANMAARSFSFEEKQQTYNYYGGFSNRNDPHTKSKDAATFSGPNWFTEQMNGVY